MAAANASKGLVGLLKRQWNESPEIVGSAGFGVLGVFMLIAANYIYYSKDGDNRPYKQFYSVYRHDDPRVATLKTQCDTTSK